MKLNKILYLGAVVLSSIAFTGCSEDEPDASRTVLNAGNTEKNEFDLWLQQNLNEPYNIDFKYRYEDVQGDFNYYLVPCRYEDAIVMAHLIKHLCVEAYNETAGTDFTCTYFPKMFYVTGEWEYKNNGSHVLGTAEGGRKIYLMGLNYLPDKVKNPTELNSSYFRTIHHEFTHILNQTKPIPADFQLITANDYVNDMCFEKPYNVEYINNGFISAYSQKAYTEDFAEIVAHYVCNTDDSWNKMVSVAPASSKEKIEQKVDMVKSYMKTSFGIDLDKLRDVVQRRQLDIVNGEVNLSDVTLK